jgi:2-keto-4-pentenoate hydratase/2-oxohepta-3-ene-1,7-dioic acid hydratase in catechol pathway
MRLCRFNENRIGLVDGAEVVDVSAVADDLPAVRWPLPLGDMLVARLDGLRRKIERLAGSGRRHPLREVRLLSPVANPGKIIGIGRSYKAHAEEALRDPSINHGVAVGTSPDTIRMFIKANSALVGPSQGVALRFLDRRNDPELELAIVIGKTGTMVPRERALDLVAGYAIGFDMTLRGPEPPSSRKSIDSYAVLGPWLATPDEVPDPDNVDLTLRVNGEVRQRSTTRDLIFPVAAMIENAAKFYTLHPGDVILTGTPEGVAAIAPGDVLDAEISGIGAMRVEVRAHAGETVPTRDHA